MTKTEAEKLAAIALTVDEGCGYCLKELLDKFTAAFPEQKDVFDKAWIEFTGA
jgi:hypothetical protein